MNWFGPHEHDDNTILLASKSHFVPYKEPEIEPEPCMINMFEEKKKRNEEQYEPGVKLLMKLGKIREKEKKNVKEQSPKDFNVDLALLSNSLSRVLKSF